VASRQAKKYSKYQVTVLANKRAAGSAKGPELPQAREQELARQQSEYLRRKTHLRHLYVVRGNSFQMVQ